MMDARKMYGDIIDLEHFVSKKRPRMPLSGRAAQFAPFAALSGYEDMVCESVRETERRPHFREDRAEELNGVFLFLFHQKEAPCVSIRYFISDKTKPGGRYGTASGRIARYDEYDRRIVLDTGEKIFLDDIVRIESDAVHFSF